MADAPMTAAERQKAHRARQQERLARMEEALRAIVARLDGNAKALAVELRALAHEGLGEKEEGK